MVGELSPVLSSRVCRLRGRAGKAAPPSASFAPRPGPPHTTHTTWRPERRHLLDDKTNSTKTRPKAPSRPHSTLHPRKTRRNHKYDEEEDHQHTRRPTKFRLGVLHALLFLLAFCSALLRVPVGSFEKRGVPQFQRLAPPCLSLRPTSSSCGKLREREHYPFPAPHSHEPTNDERSPLFGAWENRRENPRAYRSSFLFFLGVIEIPCSFCFVEMVL